MGRLIDADDIEFKKKFCKRFCTNLADVTTCERKENCGIMEWIDNQPTAYDVDKVVEAIKFKQYFDELYGTGLEVANWHLNGDLEPFDDFYESALQEGAVKDD